MKDERGNLLEVQTLGVINVILGAWLIISPYVNAFGYTTADKWNQTIIGIVVLVLAIIRISAPQQRWISFLNGLAGVWAIIAPGFINFNSRWFWNEIIVGIVIAALAFWSSGIQIEQSGHHHHHPSPA